MEETQELMIQLDTLFHPNSVAVVGVPRGMKSGKLFLMALLDQGFPGPIYPVHPEASEIEGLKAYPSVSAIPGPVDLAIVLVPHYRALSVIRECAAKGVKGAQSSLRQVTRRQVPTRVRPSKKNWYVRPALPGCVS